MLDFAVYPNGAETVISRILILRRALKLYVNCCTNFLKI